MVRNIVRFLMTNQYHIVMLLDWEKKVRKMISEDTFRKFEIRVINHELI